MKEHRIHDRYGVLICTCGLVAKDTANQEDEMLDHMDDVHNNRAWKLMQ